MDIKINEILPDPEGTDDGFEFIELFNTSDDDVSIEGWSIATGTSSWPSDPGYRFPAGASVPAGGFVVVAGNEVEDADFYTDEEEKFSLGNGSSAPDGVRLEDYALDRCKTLYCTAIRWTPSRIWNWMMTKACPAWPPCRNPTSVLDGPKMGWTPTTTRLISPRTCRPPR